MAVHAYRALMRYGKEAPNPIVYSYLDSQQLRLCIDRPDSDALFVPITTRDLSVDLRTIFSLHRNISKTQLNFLQTPQLPELATNLATVVSDQETSQQWFDWFIERMSQGAGDNNKAARKPKKRDGRKGNWKSKTQLKELTFAIDTLPALLASELEEKGFLNAEHELSLAQATQLGNFKEPEKFCKWLDGLWLEHYVLHQIANMSEKLASSSYGLNFNFMLDGTEKGFEFDVAFTHGYQLFAISCTTYGDQSGQRGACKLKLLEAYIRAQQMGGTEARVALVCLADNPNSIRSELSGFLGRSKVRVFGRSDLLTLDKELEKWIKNNDAELKR